MKLLPAMKNLNYKKINFFSQIRIEYIPDWVDIIPHSRARIGIGEKLFAGAMIGILYGNTKHNDKDIK